MMNQEYKIWDSSIEFDEAWRDDTPLGALDDILPSWYEKRKEFKPGNPSYDAFIQRMNRQHAIETGVIEQLYDVSDGLTQTLLKEGFSASYVSHDDSSVSALTLMDYLQDQLNAIEFVFEMVGGDRGFSTSFIKELHGIVTNSQGSTDAIDSLGKAVKVPLIKGNYKTLENNPKRVGAKYLYCPPALVASEMDRLIQIYEAERSDGVHPVILAAWFHHSFTVIHPFQDGNGRMARLLSSLILIKDGLLPLNVLRSQKTAYIKALEKADKRDPLI